MDTLAMTGVGGHTALVSPSAALHEVAVKVACRVRLSSCFLLFLSQWH